MDHSGVAYYVPLIPDVWSTTRYQHALAIANLETETSLLIEREPPEQLYTKFDHVHILTECNVPSIFPHLLADSRIVEILSRPLRAAAIARDRVGPDGVYVTSFHYIPALSGWLSGCQWVADVYDDPTQPLLTNPKSITHRARLPLLQFILNRADLGYNVLHPTAERTFGKIIEYGINGAPLETITPAPKPSRPPLKCVIAGKTTPDQGLDLLIRSLQLVDCSIHVDVYGEPFEESRQLAITAGVNDMLTFHGWSAHDTVIEAIRRAHVGLAVLPPRPDWVVSYPIKVGEYLAAGTLPLVTDLPGMRRLTSDACISVDPDSEQIARALDDLAVLNDEEFQQQWQNCRDRAIEINWGDERERFATAVRSQLFTTPDTPSSPAR